MAFAPVTGSRQEGASLDAERLLWTQWGLLLAAAWAGVVVAALVASYPFDFSREIAEAKRLGIVSRTILAGYPKSRDLLLYALLVLCPVFSALGAWLAWSRGKRAFIASLLADRHPAPLPGGRPLLTLGLLAGSLLLQFNLNNFYQPAGGWAFLGEEGQFLADAQALLAGGVYARDFLCLYGPLAVYPLAFAMKLFGATVMVGRFYTYLLSVLSAAILVSTLTGTLRDRRLLAVATLVMAALFVSGGGRTGATMMRVMLGFLPLLLLYRDAARGRIRPVAAGLALGASLLFSQEVGLCSLIASAGFLVLEAWQEGEWRRFAARAASVAAGCAVAILPVLAWFGGKGALARFFESIYGYPKLVTLGFGALPFPSPAQLLSAPFSSGAYFPYWMIGLYVAAAIVLLLRLLLGLGDRDLRFRAALLVFGMLLFRAALGRSDESHYFFALPPALLLVFLFLDDAVSRRGASACAALETGRGVAAGALLASLLLLLGSSGLLRGNLAAAAGEVGQVAGKFSVAPKGVALPQFPRGGGFYDAATAQDLVKIGAALDRHARPGESVLFFPNEAAYYFLFDRPIPTRYVHAYFAITSGHRQEMVAELERARPKVVVHTLDNWRMDDILEDVAVPEVVAYLKANYRVAEDLGNVLILVRKGN